MWRLSDLASLIPGSEVEGTGNPEITRIDYDSRRVQSGSLFVAIPGHKTDGHQFIHEAVARGAAAVAVKLIPPGGISQPLVRVPDPRQALALFAGALAEHPDRQLALAGITGTNGKTTTAFLLAEILAQGGKSAGLVSTIGNRVGGQWLPAERTTPEAPDIYRLLQDMHSTGCWSAAMEVSSHALELQRVYGLTFATVAYTNLTQDHLDFHGNMKSYFLAKARLFQEYNYQTAVINIDDPYGLRLLGMISRPAITYSLASPAAVQAIDVKQTIEGLQIRARTPQGELEFRSPLVGKFNVYNLLCGLAAAESLGLHSDEFIGAAEKFRGAPGRMERFDLGQRWVYVDYAHTPDALRQVIAELRELTRGPVHVLFGCGGNRDRGKRSLMGQAADELADRIYLTTDNPRDEDPEEITAEILAGITQRQKTLTILNRREAIRTALDILPRHGVLLIAGKGHEDYQEIRGVKYPFDDRAEVRQYLAEKGN